MLKQNTETEKMNKWFLIRYGQQNKIFPYEVKRQAKKSLSERCR